MAPKPKAAPDAAILELGATEGEEIRLGDVHWGTLMDPSGSILELCTLGSSLNIFREEWIALLTGRHKSDEPGIWVTEDVLDIWVLKKLFQGMMYAPGIFFLE